MNKPHLLANTNTHPHHLHPLVVRLRRVSAGLDVVDKRLSTVRFCCIDATHSLAVFPGAVSSRDAQTRGSTREAGSAESATHRDTKQNRFSCELEFHTSNLVGHLTL